MHQQVAHDLVSGEGGLLLEVFSSAAKGGLLFLLAFQEFGRGDS